MDEDLLSLFPAIPGECALYRTLFERIGITVGTRVMDEVMEGAALDFGECVAGQG